MNNPSDFTRKVAPVTGAHSEPFSRREFLASTALAGAALSVGSASWAAQAAAQSGELEKRKNKMKIRKLGKLEVSELGFGNMGLSGGHYGPGADRPRASV